MTENIWEDNIARCIYIPDAPAAAHGEEEEEEEEKEEEERDAADLGPALARSYLAIAFSAPTPRR